MAEHLAHQREPIRYHLSLSALSAPSFQALDQLSLPLQNHYSLFPVHYSLPLAHMAMALDSLPQSVKGDKHADGGLSSYE